MLNSRGLLSLIITVWFCVFAKSSAAAVSQFMPVILSATSDISVSSFEKTGVIVENRDNQLFLITDHASLLPFKNNFSLITFNDLKVPWSSAKSIAVSLRVAKWKISSAGVAIVRLESSVRDADIEALRRLAINLSHLPTDVDESAELYAQYFMRMYRTFPLPVVIKCVPAKWKDAPDSNHNLVDMLGGADCLGACIFQKSKTSDSLVFCGILVQKRDRIGSYVDAGALKAVVDGELGQLPDYTSSFVLEESQELSEVTFHKNLNVTFLHLDEIYGLLIAPTFEIAKGVGPSSFKQYGEIASQKFASLFSVVTWTHTEYGLSIVHLNKRDCDPALLEQLNAIGFDCSDLPRLDGTDVSTHYVGLSSNYGGGIKQIRSLECLISKIGNPSHPHVWSITSSCDSLEVGQPVYVSDDDSKRYINGIVCSVLRHSEIDGNQSDATCCGRMVSIGCILAKASCPQKSFTVRSNKTWSIEDLRKYHCFLASNSQKLNCSIITVDGVHYFIATAKHSVATISENLSLVLLDTSQDYQYFNNYDVIGLNISREAWQMGDSDVAILPLEVESLSELDRRLIKNVAIELTSVMDHGLKVLDQCYILTDWNRELAVHEARVCSALIENPLKQKEENFLLYPGSKQGSSGSPIFAVVNSKLILVGIVSAGITENSIEVASINIPVKSIIDLLAKRSGD